MSTAKRNFYEILNATPNATFEELKSNYKQLILQCHPDKLQQQLQNDTNTTTAAINATDKLENDLNNQEFVGLTEAWNCLRDPLKRKRYDAELLLNKFHTHSNVYAHIQLNEMKKCTITEIELEPELSYGQAPAVVVTQPAAGGVENHKEDQARMKNDCGGSDANAESYIYTYDCRCGGQYIVDESAEQYCRKVNRSKTNAASTVAGAGADDDADISPNNKNPKTACTGTAGVSMGAHVDHTLDGGGDHGHGGGGFASSKYLEEEEGSDDGDSDLIVECSECSLVIILNS
ncbi:uncharacterized protein LOC106096365 isoform X1 [Stomoxys calcitrans]|uniref:J domain-containing protein n=1 Tax=Stomoxys calcitrans TaxID=35570 RepID=A0A1I8PXL9_STOCA|nr:uncharacterized protein LOC106096365 isoform X1 [Stomoxys calcitrans]XP_059218587.1 uncharacterized protein LOC106096365 isoform X1 [Stomoxys calcitrans]